MSAVHQGEGIPSTPIALEEGKLVVPLLDAGPLDPQNLWMSLLVNQEWVGNNLGLGLPDQYTEAVTTIPALDIRAIQEEKLHGPANYVNIRGVESMAGMLNVSERQVIAELAGTTILDIGSGIGALGQGIRPNGTRSIEVDISERTLLECGQLQPSDGIRAVADARALPFKDGTFQRTVSMYAASIHTDTVYDRLSSLSEALRVTEPGGRVFVMPLFRGLEDRQMKWYALSLALQQDPALSLRYEVQQAELTLMREAAIDYAMTYFVGELMRLGTVDLSPILIVAPKQNGKLIDCISGIFDIKQPYDPAKAERVIGEMVTLFSGIKSTR